MHGILQRLRERKLVQWALAYIAAAFALIQVLDVVAQRFGWPDSLERVLILALVVGFFVTLVLAWYHGERGVQRVSSTELVILALLLAIGGGLLWRYERTAPVEVAANMAAPPATAASIPAKSIAVLPFENLSHDTDNKYFADGMQDLILTKLAVIGDLKVISRTSTEKYASRPDDLKTIAQQLGVATLLEGSVQKAGNQVLINVQLIDASTDAHIWAESYQRTLDNIFGVEGEVAQKVADALKAKLTPGEQQGLVAVPTRNPAAYQAYLKALELDRSATGSAAGLEQVIDRLQTAVELDPGFTLAWTELVGQDLNMYWYGFDPTQTRLDAAKLALDRAESLAPDLPQVKLARANFEYVARLDFTGSLALIRAVLPSVPNDAAAWFRAAVAERRLGQWDAMMRDLKHAQTLDPLNNKIKFDIANSMLAQHDYAALLTSQNAYLSTYPDATGAQELKLFAIWNLEGLDAADRALAFVRPREGAAIALRAQQALYRRDFKSAADLFAQAISDKDAEEYHSEFFVGSYLPASVGWRLSQALSEQRAGSPAKATALYREVQTRARTALAAKPVDPYVAAAWHSVLGLACAGIGERAEAVAAGKQAVALIPESKDAYEGPLWLDYLAQIYAMNGDVAQAMPLLERLLQTKGSQTTPALLRLDPIWDAIRHDPAFQALLARQGQPYTPAGTAAQ
ncbi:MAG: hypothetical protein JSR27_09565 [Proteobacteria bacterium]|nr:hypothetical protein [Pseudomonadota bacterium]